MKTNDEMIRSVHERIGEENERIKIRNATVKKCAATVSCFALTAAIAFGVYGAGLRILGGNTAVTDGADVSESGESASADSEILPPVTENIIYASGGGYSGVTVDNEYMLGDPTEEENLFSDAEPGKLLLMGKLTEAVEKEESDSALFAVGIVFDRMYSMPEDEEYLSLEAQINELVRREKDNYYTHWFEAGHDEGYSGHPFNGNDGLCDTCREIKARYERDYEEARRLMEMRDEIRREHYAEFCEDTARLAREYLASLGLDSSEVTAVWAKNGSEVTENTEKSQLFILYLTEVEISALSGEGLGELGARAELIPEELDNGESVIYLGDRYSIELE